MRTTMPAVTSGSKTPVAFRQALLAWYDDHARVLPWRVRSGQLPDPYHVWLSEIMLQQTTVPAVIPYFGKFVDKWPTVQALASADDDAVMQAWAGLGYYARARNLLKCARIVSEFHNGVFPDSYDALLKLPGIGDYTAAAITAIAFNRVATVIDGNVDRVVARYSAITEPLPDSKPDIRKKAQFLFEGGVLNTRPGDFAQAMMDLGATICTPRNPACGICPVAQGCKARKMGVQGTLPAKKAKPVPPRRAGYIYWITNNKAEVLLEKRPETGLLGAMTGFPTSDWREWADDNPERPEISHISAIKLCQHITMKRDVRILHVFTHFRLELQGVFMKAPPAGLVLPPGYFWAPIDSISDLGFPTVFKKFARLASVADRKASG